MGASNQQGSQDASLLDWPAVPDGKVRLAEYGSGVPMARRTALDDRWIAGKHWHLTRVGRGFVIAGSVLRFTETVFKVTYEDVAQGTTHGRSFKTEAAAWEYLAALEDRACREAQS